MTINAKYFRHRLYPRLRHGRKLTSFISGVAAALATTAVAQAVAPVRTTNTKAEALITISGGTVVTTNYVEISGRRYTFKATLTEVKASKTLTNDGTDVTAADTVTIGGQVYTFKTALTEVKAQGVLAASANATNADTVTIGTKVYTFQDTLTNVDGHVKIGADAQATLLNLFHAINASGGTSGTDYATATVAHTLVSAVTAEADNILVKAKTSGVAGNAIASTSVSSTFTWGGALFTLGVDPVANEVLRGVSNTATMTALFEAINAGAAAGTDYSRNTVANASVTATNPSATTVLVTAILPGVAGNLIAIAEASSHLSWASAAVLLSGGVDPVADEVIVGNGTTESRDNLIAAVNAASGAGSTYSTGTTANTLVVASASSANVLLTAASAANVLSGQSISLVKSGAHLSVPTMLDGPAWTATSHPFTEGEGPFLLTTDGALPAGSPAAGTELYVHVISASTIALAAGRGALRRGDFIQTTSAGTGNHNLSRSETASGVFDTLKRGVKPRTAYAATDIDSL